MNRPPRTIPVKVTNLSDLGFVSPHFEPTKFHRANAKVIYDDFDQPKKIVAYDGENIITIFTGAMQSGATAVTMVYQSCDNYHKVFHKAYERGQVELALQEIETQLTEWIG